MKEVKSLMTDEQEKTFQDLQKPTMSLIGAFYQMTPDVRGVFLDMMAVYEAAPNEETAKVLSDKIMGRESPEDKKKWLKEAVVSIPSSARVAAKRKYIDEQQAVPKGVPTSGMVLAGLEIVSRAEKDALMEAQAAARLISHVDVTHAFERKESYQNEDGTFENAFLDKPFATKMQRLEHLVGAVVNDEYTQQEEYLDKYWQTRQSGEPMLSTENYTIPHVKETCQKSLFLQKARYEALATLRKSASILDKTNPEASKKIMDVADSLDVSKNMDIDYMSSKLKDVENFYKDIFALMPVGEGSYGSRTKEVEEVNEELAKRLNNLTEARKPLSKKDYDALMEEVKGRPVEGLVEHRVKQILLSDGSKTLVAQNGRG